MDNSEEYLREARAAEEYADMCVPGSVEEAQFRDLASQWRKLARQDRTFDPGPRDDEK